jgi:hypothetical protein
MKQDQDGTQCTKENMKLQQVFKTDYACEKIVSFPRNINADSKKNHERPHNTQPMPERTAWLKPIMLGMIKPLLQCDIVIGIAR